MKKFFRFLGVIFAASLLDSCQYDDKFIIEEYNGYSTLMYFDGAAQIRVYYLDRDNSLTFTPADTVLYREAKEGFKIVQAGECYNIFQTSGLQENIVATVCNGQTGPQGPAGQNGQDGFGLVMSVSPYPNEQNPLGQKVDFYFDKDRNMVFSLGDEYYNSLIIFNGKDSNLALALVCLTREYDFQGAGTSYFNSTGFILNNFILDEGALYLDKSSGSVTFPPFSNNMDLLSLRFNYGSKKSYGLIVKAVYADNSEEIIKTVNLEGNPNFDREAYSTYSHFEYYADLENIKFKDISAIKLYGSLSGKCVPEDLFIDEVVICLKDRNVH